MAALTTVFTTISTVAAAHNTSGVAAAVAAAPGVVATVTAAVGVPRERIVWLGPGVRPQLLGIRRNRKRHGPWGVGASDLLALDGTAQ